MRPIIDEEEIPDEPYDLYQNGNITNAEIMIDYTLNEAQTFMTVNVIWFITRVLLKLHHCATNTAFSLISDF